MLTRQFKRLLGSSNVSRKFSSIEKTFSESKLREYNEKGYVMLPKVFSSDLIDELKGEVADIIRKADNSEFSSVFQGTNNEEAKQRADKYFLESGDKIRFFLEKDALDEKGQLRFPRDQALNKIGHALHDLNKKFERFSYSREMKYICKMVGYKSPIIVQSMYILKNGRIGGEVSAHTDNTYLRTDPLSCMGIWVAFDDAKKTNGAMWGYPGSHKNKTEYFMRLEDENGRKKAGYIGKQEYPKEGAELIEAEKGSVVLLHGDFVHFSYPNKSDDQRHAYTIHVVESKGTKWVEDNWLQRTEIPFKFLNENRI
jgi:phytanoyl-CoA hydroxylase